MRPNIEDYRQYVDRFDLSEEQKVELIETLWRIVQTFVDQAFGLLPVQQVVDRTSPASAEPDSHAIEWSNQEIANQFRRIAARSAERDSSHEE